jgi:hypothetical protein
MTTRIDLHDLSAMLIFKDRKFQLHAQLNLSFTENTSLHGPSLEISVENFTSERQAVIGQLLPGPRFVHPDEMKKVHCDVVRTWIRRCDLEHGDICARHLSSHICLPGFQVIDCNMRKVVGAPTNCAYAALSYVWGSSNTTEDLAQASLVIEDAITCTLALNLRYVRNFWVRSA